VEFFGGTSAKTFDLIKGGIGRMDKIKSFFQSKVTKIVSWVVLALDVICLVLGGTNTVEITDGVGLIAAIVAAVAAFVAFISERVKKSK
jgi:hypothetical protein